ncbi:hypothetical protein PROFUN_02536 [Planoprotostelium fungivorum]|uniref:Uncharacterized protein n=1 Tax=Planoprotostelium fungivorum TaxID=1890364 RepID=A0A2P6MPA6_9EUKA|nr:hypothetical protein PROFUN_02536 [Planoprotostelium fungivorum]
MDDVEDNPVHFSVKQRSISSLPNPISIMAPSIAAKRLPTELQIILQKIIISQIAAYLYQGGWLYSCDRQDQRRNNFARIKFHTKPPKGSTLYVYIVEARSIVDGQKLDHHIVKRLSRGDEDQKTFLTARLKTTDTLTQPLLFRIKPNRALPQSVRFLFVLKIAGRIAAAGYSMESLLYSDREECLRKRTEHAEIRRSKGIRISAAPTPQENMQKLVQEYARSLSPGSAMEFRRQLLEASEERVKRKAEEANLALGRPVAMEVC